MLGGGAEGVQPPAVLPPEDAEDQTGVTVDALAQFFRSLHFLSATRHLFERRPGATHVLPARDVPPPVRQTASWSVRMARTLAQLVSFVSSSSILFSFP